MRVVLRLGLPLVAGGMLFACAGEDMDHSDGASWMTAGPPAGAGADGAPQPMTDPGPAPAQTPAATPGPDPDRPAPAQPDMPEDACATGELDSDADGTRDCDDACPEDAMKVAAGACGCGQPEPADGTDGCPVVCEAGEPDCMMPGDTGEPGPEDEVDPDLCSVAPIPEELRSDHDLDDVYTRYASARGVPILASDSPEDEAMRRACMMVRDLSENPDVLETMLDRKIGLVVMGVDETSADFPEFAAWGVPDSRARGLGGVPRGLCAEENVMCDTSRDRWRGESICLHEFAHTMHLGVYNIMDSTFDDRVRSAYRAAMSAGKYENTYAASSAVEYFAEAAQDWYNTNLESARPNGVHNEINTRAELLEYDPEIYGILAEVLPDEPKYQDCYYYE